jgi:hypothetical protein
MSVYRVGGNKSSQNVFPSVRPTLDLDFANSKTLDPRITFTRASGGSYVGADGLIKYAGVNEARFDHDPSTGESLGLLIEEARTNLATFSEDWQSFHFRENVDFVLNDVISPDGTLTADKLVCTAGGIFNSGLIQKITSISANTSWYTCSWFIKNNGAKESNLQIAHSGGTFIAFTVKINWTSGDTPTFLQSSASGTANRIIHPVQKFPNGWFRFSISQQNNGTGTSLTNRIYVSSSTSTVNGDSVYSWGSQMELGQFPTSYIPTQASTRTRARDTAVITGKNFSDFYNKNESTVFVKFKIDGNFGADGFNRVFEISDGGVQSRYALLKLGSNSPNLWDFFSISNINELNFNTIPYSYGSFLKYSVSFSQNNFTRYSTNTLGTISSSIDSTLPLGNFNPNQLNIGYEAVSGVRQLGGTISRFMYYPKVLTREQLQALIR